MSYTGYRHRSVLAVLALLGGVVAPGVAQQAPQQKQHTVRRGDTLWDLSSSYLGNPFLWPMIYEANRGVVEDPHWIYPLEVLNIPPITPVGARAPGAGAQPLGIVAAEPQAGPEPAEEAEPAVLETIDLRRPVISPAEYRSTPWLSPATEPLVRGRLVRLGDPSEGDNKIPAMVHPNYRVHVGDLHGAAAQAGDSLLVVRFGRIVEGWGQVVEPLAILRVDQLNGTTLSAAVVRQFDEARVGDRVIALEAIPMIPVGELTPVADGAQGELLKFWVEQPLYGTGEHAFVSLGEDRVRLGDELAVYFPPERADALESAVVPATEVALARVVRVAGRSATVRLTRVSDTSLTEGLPVQLVRRAP
jgi:hypothetical protein